MSKPIALAVIGGTGLYRLADLQDVETHQPVTHFGSPSGPIRVGTRDGHRVAFLARHGEGHSLPPHQINYRANLAALKAIGDRTFRSARARVSRPVDRLHLGPGVHRLRGARQ